METDYIDVELSYDDGTPNQYSEQNLAIGGVFKGVSVRFIPTKTNGTIKNFMVYILPTDIGGTDKAKLSVHTLDKRGRRGSLLENVEISFESGKWNTISLEEYRLKPQGAYYITLESAVEDRSFAIGVSRKADTEFSYIYESGNFVPIKEKFNEGGLMIRSIISYPKNATDLDFDIPQPTLKPIYPEDSVIEGTAQVHQKIKLEFKDKLILNTIADENGKFKFDILTKLLPGDEVKCYAKDVNGALSQATKGIVLTDKSELKNLLKSAEIFKNKDSGSLKNTNLLNKIAESQRIIEDIKVQEITASDRNKILELQQKIADKVIELSEAISELSPEKKALKEIIEQANEEYNNTWRSSKAEDVPTTKYWASAGNRATFKTAIGLAESVYNNPNASVEVINAKTDELKLAKEKFDTQRKRGTQELPVISSNHSDGYYQAKGKISGNKESDLLIQIKSGKIVDIQIENLSDNTKNKIIEEDRFLARIIS